MKSKLIAAALVAATVAACTPNRGGVADVVLDRSLYKAETKAERLLRYYQVQALLVRYAAENAGSHTDRTAIARSNVNATERLLDVLSCLRDGSASDFAEPAKVDGQSQHRALMDDRPKALAPAAIRAPQRYCSFFDSRMLPYEDALWSLMRQVIKQDEDAIALRSLISNLSIADAWSVARAFLNLIGRAVRDERILAAFRADVWELEALVLESVPGPECVDPAANYLGLRVERADAERMKKALDGKNSSPADGGTDTRPTVRVWQFREVSAFMKASCRALNGDLTTSKLDTVVCSAGIPFIHDQYGFCSPIEPSDGVPDTVGPPADSALVVSGRWRWNSPTIKK